ncbi:ubiquitin-like protein-NEDD8-like protein RUB3 [Trichogramma pretiosum]|uniref:ubiquitin-like protein-NEDD8-like protein RUB3 n=1 Tax=Trichogramma pretiosum TaxID=7493 RepID=UPI000C71B4F7|nr:ubiquitin-like protein-NEDD8-like protein RUB3 [Trichogramma pretiosum]
MHFLVKMKDFLNQINGQGPIWTVINFEYEMDLEPTDTVEKIKENIEEDDGTPVDRQRLIFCGRQLEDHKALKDYNIQEGSVVFLIPRHGGPCHVCFRRMAHELAKDLEAYQMKYMADKARSLAERLEIWANFDTYQDELKCKQMAKLRAKIMSLKHKSK